MEPVKTISGYMEKTKVPEVDCKMDQDHDTGYFAVSSTADLTPMKRAGCSTEKERDGRATWLLVLSGMATTFGASLPVGYNIGVINAPSAVIQKWCSDALLQRYSITLTPATLAIVWSTIVSIFLIGGMIGSLAGSWFAHQIGRKGTLIVSGVLGVVAGILFLTSKDPHLIEFIFIGRFLVGLSSGLITGVMPMYLCEIAPPNLRGVMGVLCPLGLTFGVVFSQFMGMSWILGTEEHWHYLLALYAILIIVCGLALPFMPESPKYLYYIKGLKQRACRDMSRLRGEPLDSVSRELESQGALNEITGEGWTIARLLATRNLRLPLALTCALQAGQQTSGINAVFYYSMKIFESAGLSVAEQQYASLGAGLVNFGVAVVMLPLVNKLPHRTLTISSSCMATLTLFLLTISISYINAYYWMPYLCVFSVMFYVLVYGVGLGPIPYFIGSELFEVGPRPSAMALGSVANWSGNFSVGMLFPSLQRVMGPYSFLVFAFCTSLLTIFLHMFLPETNPRHMYEREESHESTTAGQHTTTDRMLFKSIHDL